MNVVDEIEHKFKEKYSITDVIEHLEMQDVPHDVIDMGFRVWLQEQELEQIR